MKTQCTDPHLLERLTFLFLNRIVRRIAMLNPIQADSTVHDSANPIGAINL